MGKCIYYSCRPIWLTCLSQARSQRSEGDIQSPKLRSLFVYDQFCRAGPLSDQLRSQPCEGPLCVTNQTNGFIDTDGDPAIDGLRCNTSHDKNTILDARSIPSSWSPKLLELIKMSHDVHLNKVCFKM